MLKHQFSKTLLLVAFLFGFFQMATAQQTARVQIIHNSSDPAADSVDVYVDLGIAGIAKFENVAYRTATTFQTLPANVPITVAVAGKNSASIADSLKRFTVSLSPNSTNLAIATGVLNLMGTSFATNPDGVDNGFRLLFAQGREAANNANEVDVTVVHSSTDAPSVGVNANGNVLLDSVAYLDVSGYVSIPPTDYRIDLTAANDPTSIVAPFFLDASGLAGASGAILASGFFTPANNENGPALGLFLVPAAGGNFIPLTPVGNARAQVIHNSADPAASTVDIYVDINTDTVLLDDVDFRTATGFLDLPSGYPVDITVAPGNSASVADGLATVSVTLGDNSTNLAIASGVLNLMGSSFEANPDAVDNNFTILFTEGREAATGSDVDVTVVHGSTDAPSVGVSANAGVLLDSVAYQDISGYVSIPAAQYRIDVTGANDPSTVIAPFYLDASGLGGGAVAVLASGFLTPANDENGEAFGLFAVPATGGAFLPLAPVGSARAQIIHNAADPAAATVDIYIDLKVDTLKLDDVPFRGATGFLDIPSGYPLDVVIAGPTSTDITDGAIATIPVTASDSGSFYIIANGVVDPTGFAANPDSISTAFNLFVKGGAREAAAVATNVDLAVFHGATDAPSVDVVALGAGVIVDSAAYTDITGYLELPAASYDLSVTPEGDNATVVGSYRADATGLAGGAGLILASGFLTPGTNQGGEAFGLLLVTPDTAFMLSVVTSNEELLPTSSVNVYPNPARAQVNLDINLETAEEVTYELLDIQGRVIFRGSKNMVNGSASIILNTESAPRGMNFIRVRTANAELVKKLIIE